MMSSLEESVQAPGFASPLPSAARVGADLRLARERLGWALPAMAAHLRIRLCYLEAIEEGRTGDLPGNAYAVGFLRTYASALGLDQDEIGRRFRAEASEVNRKTELSFPAPVPERGVPAGALVLLGAVLAVGAYVGWYRASAVLPPTAQVEQVPERLAPLADAALAPRPAPAPAPPVAIAAATVAAPPAVAADPPPAEPPAPGPALSMSSAAAASSSTGMYVPPVVPAPSPAATLPVADETRIVLRARADSWLQVRDRQGQVLLNRVLRAGETWPVPVRPNLLLTTGNAGGTEILVDGTLTPGLGADGAVRRDLSLDPDTVKDGKLALLAPAKAPVKGQ
jgi:cytoskeleton protein RodZ